MSTPRKKFVTNLSLMKIKRCLATSKESLVRKYKETNSHACMYVSKIDELLTDILKLKYQQKLINYFTMADEIN